MTKSGVGKVTSAILALVCSGLACAQSGKGWSESRQALVVTTSGWESVGGRLQRYERNEPGREWKAVGEAISVVVGKNGMAWGAGLDSASLDASRGPSDPVKKEGDGRSPAGIFWLGHAFGYAAQKPAKWKQSYIPMKLSEECVDDPESKYYNRVLDRTEVKPDWNGSEQMRREDDQYKWGIIVEHNMDPVKSGGGSCIFVHIWQGPGIGTTGCTAMSAGAMEQLLGWLDEKKHPALIQMPADNYRKLEVGMKLPKLISASRQ